MKRKQPKHRSLTRRFLGHETLERRSMLTGSPWQNPMASDDVNNDGEVTPSDLVMEITTLNGGMVGQLSGRMTAPTADGSTSKYFDADGDGELAPKDLVKIITRLNAGGPIGDDGGDNDDGDGTADGQPGSIGPDTPSITLDDHGLGRARAAINSDGDVDVFQVTAAAAVLNVALFTRPGIDMTLSVEDADGNVLGTASSADAQTHHPAAVTSSVTAGSTYFIVVSGGSGVTGDYCVQVINNDTGDVPPPPDHGPGQGEPHGPPTGSGGDDSGDGGSDSGGSGSDDEGGDPTGGDGDDDHQPPPTPAQVFAKLDTDSDGSLSLAEFEALPPPKDATVTPSDVFAKLDTDSSGGLSLDEFAALPAPPPPDGPGAGDDDGSDSDDGSDQGGGSGQGGPQGGPGGGGQGGPGGGSQTGGGQSGPQTPPPPPEAIFAKLDTDSNGSLTEAEFAPFVPASSPVPADEVFAHWDTDSSGTLTLAEFKLGLGPLKKH